MSTELAAILEGLDPLWVYLDGDVRRLLNRVVAERGYARLCPQSTARHDRRRSQGQFLCGLQGICSAATCPVAGSEVDRSSR